MVSLDIVRATVADTSQMPAKHAISPTTVYFSVPSSVNISLGGAYGVRNNSNNSHSIVAKAIVPRNRKRFENGGRVDFASGIGEFPSWDVFTFLMWLGFELVG